MFLTIMNWLRHPAGLSDLLNNVSRDTAFLDTAVLPFSVSDEELWYPSMYIVKEYVRFHVPKIDARRLTIVLTEEVFVRHASIEKQEVDMAR